LNRAFEVEKAFISGFFFLFEFF